MSALTPRQLFNLDEACKPLVKAYGVTPYLVGTAAETKQPYRDVDVRLIFPNGMYDNLQKVIGQEGIAFTGFVIGAYLESKTGLPIDFQFQRMTEANDRHNGVRNPLGCRELSDYKGDAGKAMGQQS